MDIQIESLPLRERGLKFYLLSIIVRLLQSLPLRERGLKWLLIPSSFPGEIVAPLAGAWIEIVGELGHRPRPGMSLPLRERGLKYLFYANIYKYPRSLPLRERGLK